MSSRPPPADHRHHHPTTSHLLPPITGTTVAFSLLLLLLLLWRRLFHRKTLKSPPPSTTPLPRRFSYSTLRRATASFSPSRRLGQGGFGAVYSGTLTLASNRKVPVAIKLMDSGSLQGEHEFQNEILMANKLVDSDRVVKLLGFATSRKRRRMCLVYELMPNGNLQDCLLHRKSEELMEWSNRFRIAIEIARGLAYLHHQCDPPVIHGDIKPSNILLDDNFCAKIGDFGLARLKLVDNNIDVVININENEGIKGEDNGSIMETESVTTTVGLEEVDQSPVRVLETSPEMVTSAASPSEILDKGSDLEGQLSRVSGENNGKVVKDYVMEWIGTEIDKEIPPNDWIGGATSSNSIATGRSEKKGKMRLGWWASLEDGKISKKRAPREWWKEEYCEKLAKKKKKKKKKNQGEITDNEENWWPRDDEMYIDLDTKKKKKNKKSRSKRSSVEWWLDGLSRHTSYDSTSGEIPKSGGISSTPSMRGTMCYIAPEYSSGSDLSEKCDVYSFGVLLLVLIAGRRPLQVSGSPLCEFHRANLISWARKLARSGKLLDLIDKKIQCLNREQAQLCIVVALICLQKSPARRPSMKEVVGMLTGELDPPQLPIEYLPSPSSSKYPFKPRKKV